MSGQIDKSLLDRLRDLLVTERELIVTGRAKEAVGLIEDKASAMEAVEAAVNALPATTLPAPERREIESVIQIARENAVYFEAIRHGLRSAISRLEGMHANAYVGSYGAHGQQLAFPQATGAYRKKA